MSCLRIKANECKYKERIKTNECVYKEIERRLKEQCKNGIKDDNMMTKMIRELTVIKKN